MLRLPLAVQRHNLPPMLVLDRLEALAGVVVLGLHLALRRDVLDWVPVRRLTLVPKRDVQEWVPVRLLRRLLWVEGRRVVLVAVAALDLWLALKRDAPSWVQGLSLLLLAL